MRRVLTTRAGGVSREPYSSFNLGDHVGDKPSAVEANRRRLAQTIGLPSDRLVWMEQVHSRNVTVVTEPVQEAVAVTDALVTDRPDLALVVLTADCVPLLLSDESAGVVAAVHAGRVGARIGILPQVLDAMSGLGAAPERIGALLGPAACGLCYEVPGHMRDDVETHLPGSAGRTRTGTPSLDIRIGLTAQLEAAGVRAITVDPRCTIEDKALFSHRRGAPTGRQAAAIWMESAAGGSGR